jgi:hypothetical protein
MSGPVIACAIFVALVIGILLVVKFSKWQN